MILLLPLKVEWDQHVVLVANKVDLVDKRVISEVKGRQKAKDYEIPLYFEASALTGLNVEDVFAKLDKICLERVRKEERLDRCKALQVFKKASSARLDNGIQFNVTAYFEALNELERTLRENAEKSKPLIDVGFAVYSNAKAAMEKSEIPSSERPAVTKLLKDVTKIIIDYKEIQESKPAVELPGKSIAFQKVR